MSEQPNKELLALIEENTTSKDKVIQTASRLYALKEELPSLVHQLGSLHNLPTEIERNLDTLSKQSISNKVQEQDKSLLLGVPKDKQEAVVNVLGETVLKEFPVSDSLNYYVNAMASAATFSVIPVVGTLIAGVKIFNAMKKKKQFEKEEKEEETVTVRTSTNVFNEALQKMEFLLENSEFQINEIANEISSMTESTKNYDMLSSKQKKEILDVIDKLSILMQELKAKIEV